MPQDALYRVGYSFINPPVVKPITKTYASPFFEIDWAVKGPSQTKVELSKDGKLKVFPSVWRRSAKNNTLKKIGHTKGEMPDFNELGQAPVVTEKSVSTTRNVWGFLDNVVKSTGEIISQRQQMELTKLQAREARPVLPFVDSGMGMLGIAAVVGIGAFFLLRK